MRVAVNAQLDPERSGGIAQVLVGLAHGLATLSGPEQYSFVCSPSSAEWLRPYLGPNQRIEVNRAIGPAPSRGVRVSDGFWESYHPDVIHFPYQAFAKTELPTVFNPHDLQHVHLPDYFTEAEIQRRDLLYGEACRSATAVAAASQLVKDDVVRHYGVAADKVHVIGWGAPTTAYRRPSAKQADAFLRRRRLPDDFAIYPAQTWPHKNHLRLLEALTILRRRYGVRLPLVCTGGLTDHFQRIERRVVELNLSSQVWFLGRVEERELVALYGAARFMIVPTLFEALSFPILEAFAEGLPVACSNVTSLPRQVGEAGLTFDPHDPQDVARVMLILHRDDDLRSDLSARGRKRARLFSWSTTARRYRDLYRSVVAENAALRRAEPKALSSLPS